MGFYSLIRERVGTNGQGLLRDNWKSEYVPNECDLPGAFMMFLGRQLNDIEAVRADIPEKFYSLVMHFASLSPRVSATTSNGSPYSQPNLGTINRDVVDSSVGKHGKCVQITFIHPEGDICTINSDSMKFETAS